MADDEKQIEIKTRARRRLVGAAALALAAVIVLPMVMDSEPRPLEQDIQVRIPPQTGSNSMASQIEPRVPSRPVEPAQEAAKPDVGAAEESPAGATASDAATGPADSEPVQPALSRKPAVEQAPPASGPAPQPEALAMDEAARAAAILAGRDPTNLAADGRFVVQVGAYRDRGNATSLEGRLKADGFSAFTERSGDKTRVRIGPFDERADAESVLARVRRMGLGGSVLQLN